VEVMSLGLLTEKDMPILWDGKHLWECAEQLIDITQWTCDYLVIDFPPGSGLEVQSILKRGVDGAIIVTIPSHIASGDVERTKEMLREYQIPIIGEIRNFAYLQCKCGRVHRIFHDDLDLGIPLVAEIPIRELNSSIIPDFDPVADRVLEHLEHPTILEPKKKRRLTKAFIKLFARFL